MPTATGRWDSFAIPSAPGVKRAKTTHADKIAATTIPGRREVLMPAENPEPSGDSRALLRLQKGSQTHMNGIEASV
jgi:hypothetical protein